MKKVLIKTKEAAVRNNNKKSVSEIRPGDIMNFKRIYLQNLNLLKLSCLLNKWTSKWQKID